MLTYSSDSSFSKKMQLCVTLIAEILNKMNFIVISLQRVKRERMFYPPFIKMGQGHINAAGIDLKHINSTYKELKKIVHNDFNAINPLFSELDRLLPRSEYFTDQDLSSVLHIQDLFHRLRQKILQYRENIANNNRSEVAKK